MFISVDSRHEKPKVRPWGTEGDQAIEIAPVIIVLTSPEDCDDIILAAAEAKKRMLAAAPAAVLAEAIKNGTTVIIEDDPADIPAIVSAAIVQGHTLTYARTEDGHGWYADLRRADGTLAWNGNGDDKAQALAHLAGRMGRQS